MKSHQKKEKKKSFWTACLLLCILFAGFFIVAKVINQSANNQTKKNADNITNNNEGQKVVEVKNIIIGPSNGFFDNATNQTRHFFNGTLVSKVDRVLNCSFVISLEDASLQTTSLQNKTYKYLGTVKPFEEKEFSFLLDPVFGRSEFLISPKCI